MADLRTHYMGLELKNPIIAGASSLTTDTEKLKKMEAAGASAIVYKSLFEEQVQLENLELFELKTEYEDRNAEMVTLFPNSSSVPSSPTEYLLKLRRAREAVTIPLFASLNALNDDTWIEYAIKVAETGINGIELNFYTLPVDSGVMRDTIESKQTETFRKVKGAVNIPVAVKLSPFYTNPLQFISALDKAGADAIVIFNRLLQPDVDIYNERHTFPYNLSSSEDLRLPLRFTGILYGNINASVCSTTGIYSGGDVIKMILAGADAVQVVSVMYRNGIDALRSMTEEIEKWMDAKGYADTDSFRGKLSLKDTRLKLTYQRAQYLDFMMNAGDILKKYRIIP